MVKIEKMTTFHVGDVINLKVEDSQLQYVGTIDSILASSNAQIRSHIIMVDDKVVGFFLIDTVYSHGFDFAEQNSLGLRSFFIDRQYQGKGYARRALQALSTYLVSHYPSYSNLYLTVNCKNNIAKDCYLKNGFHDSGNLYYGDSSGPQHIMQLDLTVA